MPWSSLAATTYHLAGQIIGVWMQNTLYYAYADHLGSVSALSKSNGDFVAGSYAHYDPFGDYIAQPQSSSNPDLTSRGFTGHQHNNTGTYDLGLIYMNARYYMPEIGRFISADTMVPNPANPQSYNRYSYVENNPVNHTDPSGHCKRPGECLVVGGAVDLDYTPELLQTAEAYLPGYASRHTNIDYCDGFFQTTVGIAYNTRDTAITGQRAVAGWLSTRLPILTILRR